MFWDNSVKSDMHLIKTKNSKLVDKTVRNNRNHTKSINSYKGTTNAIGNWVPQDKLPQNSFPLKRELQDWIITVNQDHLENNCSNNGNDTNRHSQRLNC